MSENEPPQAIDPIYREGPMASKLYYAEITAKIELDSHSTDSEYRASSQLHYEKIVEILAREQKDVIKWMQESFSDIDKQFGKGQPPRERWDPEYISWKEAQKRFDLCQDVLYFLGRNRMQKQWGSSTPKIKMRFEDPRKYIIPKFIERVERNQHGVVLLEGPGGTAKSYSAIQAAYWIEEYFGYKFGLERVAMSAQDFYRIEGTRGATRGRAVIPDDMSRWANSRNYGDQNNIIIGEMYDGFRFKNEIHFITTPKDTRIDKAVREHIMMVLEAPSADTQGIFMPFIPTFDDSGKIVERLYLHFPGPKNWDQMDCILDSVQFPPLSVHTFFPKAVAILKYEARIKENLPLKELVGEAISSLTDGQLEKVKTEVGRKNETRTEFIDWLDENSQEAGYIEELIVNYEIMKMDRFWEADAKGQRLAEVAKMEDELHDQEIEDRYYRAKEKKDLKDRNVDISKKKADLADRRLAIEEEKLRREEEKLYRRPLNERIIQLRREGMILQDIHDKLALEGYEKGISIGNIKKILDKENFQE